MRSVFLCLVVALIVGSGNATFKGGLFGGLNRFAAPAVEQEIIQPVIVPQPVPHFVPGPVAHVAPAPVAHLAPAPVAHVAHVAPAAVAVSQPVQTVQTVTEVPASAGDGNAEGIRLGVDMIKWISRNRPEMLGQLTNIAIQNPGLLQGFLG